MESHYIWISDLCISPPPQKKNQKTSIRQNGEWWQAGISWSEKKLCILRMSLDAPTFTQILLNTSWFTVWSCSEKETNECLLSALRDKMYSSLLCKHVELSEDMKVFRSHKMWGKVWVLRPDVFSSPSFHSPPPLLDEKPRLLAARRPPPTAFLCSAACMSARTLQLECRGVNKACLLCIFKPI